jgi:hypothetical protein
MAYVLGVNRTLKDAGAVNSIEPELVGGRVKWVYEEYEASAMAIATPLKLFGIDIPAESRIVDWIIDHDALGVTHFRFGTLSDDDVFMVNTAGVSADKKNMTDDGVAASLGYEVTAGDDQTFIITLSGATAGSGTIKVAVAYVTKG